MNRYKLIREYPGSPKLNTLVSKHISNRFYNFNDGTYKNEIKVSQVENYPEFWEKVVEKKYQILSFKRNDNFMSGQQKSLAFLQKDNNYLHQPLLSTTGGTELEWMLNCEDYSIHSIKKLSDGEVFTVGDKVRLEHNKKSISKEIIKIGFEKIGKCPEQLFIYTESEQSTINNYVHSKEPLFTTEDGVDIYEGDDIWIVRDFKIEGDVVLKSAGKYHSFLTIFSTKEAAEEYSIMNKPCLSINDVQNTLANYSTNLKNRLKELVKSKS